MIMDIKSISSIIAVVKNEGRKFLLEPEGLAILQAMGITTPAYSFVQNVAELHTVNLKNFAGEKVVIKIVSPEILHKSDLGGVIFVKKDHDEITKAMTSLAQLFERYDLRGFTISELVPYDPSLGGEILIGMRSTKDFGPVITYGTGGIYTEFITKNFIPGKELGLIAPDIFDVAKVEEIIKNVAITNLITGKIRGQKPRIDLGEVINTLMKFMELGKLLPQGEIAEFEVNPFVISNNKLVALDVLIKCDTKTLKSQIDRPISKIKNLLEPKSAAIIGVSGKLNAGHIILNNIIENGFDKSRLYVVKPGVDSIEGCQCYPNVKSLPEKVDLFIFSLDAHQFPKILEEIISEKRAESIIVIAGGLEEKEGTEEIVSQMYATLSQSRQSEWKGPVIDGGNCLGIRSQPGKCDTFFMPEYKLPLGEGATSPVVIISQSGGFACTQSSKIIGVNPKYIISFGNQMDLTVGDYLTFLKDDQELKVFALYIEGFKPLDGLKFLKAVKEIKASGRSVIVYKAGRTAAGAQASASHTASISGNYTVTRELAKNMGAIMTETISDFEYLIQMFAFFSDKKPKGLRLGSISNAGFINVAIGDNLGSFKLSSFAETTINTLQDIFKKARLNELMDIHNPLDITGMMGDAAYEEIILAVMNDENVDVGIVNCIPQPASLNTLPPGFGHHENIFRSDSLPMRMIQLKDKINKPWIVVVEGGELYDPMAILLEKNGIPTFRTPDHALRLFNIFCEAMVTN